MKDRCYNTNCKRFKDWGGRGIAVCSDWRNDFMSFYNCRWITTKQQARNRRSNINYTINGVTRCILEWCEILGLNPKTVYQRIHYYNWTIERALEIDKKEIEKFYGEN